MQLRRLMITLVLLVGVWHWMPLRMGVVRGDSMSPTLKNGQFFVLERPHHQDHPFTRGDIIAFRHEGVVYVKRIYAVAGDVVWELRHPNGPRVLVAPSGLPRARRMAERAPGMGRLAPLRVPDGHFYVVGDAGANSYDSRDFGPVAQSGVLGRVLR